MSPVKSIGVAPRDVRPDRVRVDRRPGLLEVRDPVRLQPARDHDLDVREARLVEPGADLLDEVHGHPAALRRGVEADAVEPVAERVGDPERLLGLVLERVDEHDPRDLRADVAVEREGRLDGVAEDQHQRVGHRPGRGEAGQPGAGRRRRPDAPADDRRVVEDVGDVGVDVPRPEADDGLGRGGVDAFAGGRGPAGRLGEHPEERGLVQAEPAIARPDAEDDLLRARCGRRRRAPRAGSRRGRHGPARGRAGSSPRRSRTARRPAGRRPPSTRAGRGPPARGCVSARLK